MVTLWSVALALAVDPMNAAQRALVDPPVLDIAEHGFSTSAVAYRYAERARDALGRHMQLFHRDYDLLITPQLPITAFAAGREVPDGCSMTRWWEWSPLTYPFNLTQQPAASLPCGFTRAGLPAALQVGRCPLRRRHRLTRLSGVRSRTPLRHAQGTELNFEF